MLSQFGVSPGDSLLLQTIVINQVRLIWALTVVRAQHELHMRQVARAYRSHVGRG